ncbi:chorismate mutase [Kibdelosporangium banguiense]|uniref:chorismate mutase n=1 Tax=Kibdelosporangium banguiense TaxID=1365924 RepID=A0ABS4TZI5_9PSEU|nr:gamma subclass chorismate mutase AroQ [Kibdelosporangium banguiense]MBP2329824.1 chorismate mutase [Kibdelosporangium banguiense]
MRIRSAIIAAVATVGLGGAGEASAQPSAGPLGPLADVAASRILLGDKVAAAKFGTTLPIDDPVREQQVLDTVAAKSTAMGLPPETSVRFFRAQIEANKIVQRGLFRYWTRHPDKVPAHRPDLAGEVRPQLDRITGEILDQLRATLTIRRPSVECLVWRLEAELSADIVHRLDKLHRDALSVSLRPSCDR